MMVCGNFCHPGLQGN